MPRSWSSTIRAGGPPHRGLPCADRGPLSGCADSSASYLRFSARTRSENTGFADFARDTLAERETTLFVSEGDVLEAGQSCFRSWKRSPALGAYAAACFRYPPVCSLVRKRGWVSVWTVLQKPYAVGFLVRTACSPTLIFCGQQALYRG